MFRKKIPHTNQEHTGQKAPIAKLNILSYFFTLEIAHIVQKLKQETTGGLSFLCHSLLIKKKFLPLTSTMNGANATRSNRSKEQSNFRVINQSQSCFISEAALLSLNLSLQQT